MNEGNEDAVIFIKYTLEGVTPVFGMQTQTDGRLVAIDKSCKAHVYDLENAAQLKSDQLGQDEEHHFYDHSFDVSASYDVAFTADSNKRLSVYRKGESGWRVLTAQTHVAPVYCTVFSHDATLLFIGDEDGRSHLVDLSNQQSMQLLHPEADSISCGTFSDDDTKIAVGSYARHIYLFDLQCRCITHTFEAPQVCGTLLFTSDAKRLIGIAQEPGLFWYDIATRSLHETSVELHERLTSAILLGERHLLIGTRSDKLYLMEYESGKTCAVITMPYSGITQLRQDASTLYVSFVNGNIIAVALDAYVKELNMHLRINEFDKAAALIEENVLLFTQPSIKKFDKLWPVQFNKARALILQGDPDEAFRLVKPFFFDSEKQAAFEHYLQGQELHQKLVASIRDKKYAEAFNLVDAHPFLEATVEYAKLDEIWQKLFKSCQKLMMDKDPVSLQKVKALLKPYTLVKSKSELTRSFLAAPTVFSDADRLLKERRFRAYFTLAEQHPFLTGAATYEKVLQIGNLTLQRLQSHEERGEFTEAMEIARYLQDFLPMQQPLQSVTNRLEKKAALVEAIARDEAETVYGLAADFEFLHHMDAYGEYHQKFLEQYRHAKEHAYRAMPAAILKELSTYLPIEYLRSSILHLLKSAYLTELRYAAERESHTVDWHASFTQFGALFGKDEDLVALATRFAMTDALGQYEDAEPKPLHTFPSTILVKP